MDNFCQLAMGFVPFCKECDHLKPVIKDQRGATTYNVGRNDERIVTTGVCLFTCEHYDVCKEAVDSDTILTLTEIGKDEIRSQKEA